MIKSFGEIYKGLMTGKPVVTPINPEKLYFDNKMMALEAVNLIKEKGF